MKVFPGISLTVYSEQVKKDRSNPELWTMWSASGYASMQLGWSTGLYNKYKLMVSQLFGTWAGEQCCFGIIPTKLPTTLLTVAGEDPFNESKLVQRVKNKTQWTQRTQRWLISIWGWTLDWRLNWLWGGATTSNTSALSEKHELQRSGEQHLAADQ